MYEERNQLRKLNIFLFNFARDLILSDPRPNEEALIWYYNTRFIKLGEELVVVVCVGRIIIVWTHDMTYILNHGLMMRLVMAVHTMAICTAYAARRATGSGGRSPAWAKPPVHRRTSESASAAICFPAV